MLSSIKPHRCLQLLVFLVAPLSQLFSQSYYATNNIPVKSPQYPIHNQFEHLSVNDGLSNQSVTCILQDRDGFMWFGTEDGLNKYDGHSFTVFKPNPSKPTCSFRNGTIRGICEGDSNRLWTVTKGGGLHEVNRSTGVVTPHPILAARAELWNKQNAVYRDSQGKIWVSTFAGLACYEPDRHQFTLYPAPDPEAAVITTFEDRQHRFWVATVRGLYLLNRLTGHFLLVPGSGLSGNKLYVDSFYQDSQDKLWLGTAQEGYSLFQLDLRRYPWRLMPYSPGEKLNSFVWRNSIHRDSTGLVWVGTTNGLYAIDPAANKTTAYYTNPGLSRSLGSSNAQAVYHDRLGMLWVGTDNGIDHQALNSKPFTTYRVTPNERMANLPQNHVTALFKDRRGQLWFSNSTTVYRLSANRQQLDSLPSEKLGSIRGHKNNVSAILSDGAEGIWFGTSDGLYHFDPTSGQYALYPCKIPVRYLDVQHIDRTPASDLWVGGEGGIASFNPTTHQYTYYLYKPGNANGLTGKSVKGLMVSQFREVWVLIDGLGACRLTTQTGRFIRYMAGPSGQLNSNDVQCIHEDKDGIIWIGTHLAGVNRFNWRTGLFSAITRSDGIPGNLVVAISSDALGNLWLSTDAGICRVDPNTKAIHSYEQTDGLPSNEFLPNAVFSQSNQLIFGSINGLLQFNPSRILDDTRPFPVRITGLTVLEKPRALTGTVIRLNHDENMLSFSFAALAYEQSEQNQYAYQLLGVDKNWVQNGNRPIASYNSLAAGSYTFRVKAANSSGFWTKRESAIQFVILPPWWDTWWAYSLYLLLVGSAVWVYIRYSINRIRQQQELALNRREAEQLKAVDELKTRFFANITHEFRTPLSLILSPVEKLLQEKRFDGPMLTLVHRNAEQLLRLINQLLDLSKLEGNYMAVSLQQGDVTDFIDHVVAVFRRSADQKGIHLRYIVSQLPPYAHVFDADKWEKILTNLLANALKFTPEGGQVTLTLTPVLTNNELMGVQIELVDSGIGISPEQLPHIFDRFYQVDTSSTRAYEGTGIGLALVNELIDLLGGTITVSSEVGEGTTFVLILPVLAVATSQDIPKISWSVPTSTVAGPLASLALTPVIRPADAEHPVPRILIVEDNDELREFLASELASDYHVLQAVDGQEGWEVTQAELPDIVLTDVMMPRMDGYGLTQLIKANVDTDHIAVVMLTAKTASQSRIDGLQQGADDYLAKPFNINELQLRLHNLISRQQKLGEHYRQQFALLTTEPESPMDLPALIEDPFLSRIYTLLDTHLDNSTISVDWLADQLAMNRKTLYRKVQSLIQLAPADLIRQYRLRKAAELLQAGNNIVETADLVGFNTASHFTTVFKDFYQQTPSEFIASRVKIL